MAATAKEPEVLEHEIAPQLQPMGSANFDTQVATAKRFPRSIARFMQHAQEMATLTPEIAASCIYAIPRDGRMIEGPSARLAEIVAHAWGNLRIQASANEADDRFIVGRGEAWDVETNVAIGYEVRRRITTSDKKGKGDSKRFSDDMIAVTGNAAASIALRNAVFKAVPSSFWKPIYLKCREVVAGKAETFHARRGEMLKAFGVMGVTKEQITGLLAVRGELDITLEHMVTLTGVYNSLKEGETTIEEAFPPATAAIRPAERKSEQQSKEAAPAPESSQGTRDAESAPPAGSPNVGVITQLVEKGDALIAVLDTGYYAGSRDEDFKKALRVAHADQKRVELVPAANTGAAPKLQELTPAPAESAQP
jgi:hypothetical protein